MAKQPRKMPKEHKQLDLTLPIKADQLGSDDDPCFGTHDIKAEECKRCGDYEVCAIVTIQKMNRAATKQEGKAKFKDIEETELIQSQNKSIATVMTKRAKKNAGKWLSISKLIEKFRIKFNLTEIEDQSITQRCIKMAKESGLKLNKELTKYRHD